MVDRTGEEWVEYNKASSWMHRLFSRSIPGCRESHPRRHKAALPCHTP